MPAFEIGSIIVLSIMFIFSCRILRCTLVLHHLSHSTVMQDFVILCQPFQSTILQREKQVVKDAAEFLVLHQIPTLVRHIFYEIIMVHL